MATYAGHEGAVFASTGAAVAFTDEATTANVARTRYQITNAVKRFITRTSAVIVETSPDGSVWTEANEEDYTLSRIGGVVEFDSAQAVGTQVRVSGDYLPMAELGQCTSWELEVSRDVQSYVVLRDGGYRRKKPTIGDSKGTISRLWMDEAVFDMVDAGTEIVLVLYVDYDANEAYGVYAYYGNIKIGNPGDGLVTEDVSFEGTGQPQYGITL